MAVGLSGKAADKSVKHIITDIVMVCVFAVDMYFHEKSDCNNLYLVSRNKLHCILLPLMGLFFNIQFWVSENAVLLVLSSIVGTKRNLLLVMILDHKTQTSIQNNALHLGVREPSPKPFKQISYYNDVIRGR